MQECPSLIKISGSRIGGHFSDVKFSDNLAPIINKELSILEMNVEKLSREVSLELTAMLLFTIRFKRTLTESVRSHQSGL